MRTALVFSSSRDDDEGGMNLTPAMIGDCRRDGVLGRSVEFDAGE